MDIPGNHYPPTVVVPLYHPAKATWVPDDIIPLTFYTRKFERISRSHRPWDTDPVYQEVLEKNA